jgi:nucleotide-binding universal stress UspA family protein
MSFSISDDYDVVLTVVGSRGYGGFRGLVVGSVTTYLVHHLDSPLLIVPPVASDE